jgi:hypothetical protein
LENVVDQLGKNEIKEHGIFQKVMLKMMRIFLILLKENSSKKQI